MIDKASTGQMKPATSGIAIETEVKLTSVENKKGLFCDLTYISRLDLFAT